MSVAVVVAVAVVVSVAVIVTVSAAVSVAISVDSTAPRVVDPFKKQEHALLIRDEMVRHPEMMLKYWSADGAARLSNTVVAPSVTVVVPVVEVKTVTLVSVTRLVVVSVVVSVVVVVAVVVCVSVTVCVAVSAEASVVVFVVVAVSVVTMVVGAAIPSHEAQKASPSSGTLLITRRHFPILHDPGGPLGWEHVRFAAAAEARITVRKMSGRILPTCTL